MLNSVLTHHNKDIPRYPSEAKDLPDTCIYLPQWLRCVGVWYCYFILPHATYMFIPTPVPKMCCGFDIATFYSLTLHTYIYLPQWLRCVGGLVYVKTGFTVYTYPSG